MSDNIKIDLNLDTVEVPGAGPYVFAVGGRTFTFNDPTHLDWQILEKMNSIHALTEHCMSNEDSDAFYATPLPGYKLNALFKDVVRHFKIEQ